MLASTLVDYLAGARIHASEEPATRRRWLWVSLGCNLGLLGFFKYLGFFARSLNALSEAAGGGAPLPVLEVVLPVGISFYTFQSMSYTIDIFRREARPTESLWHFACYVSLFPQLVAGPIVRYSHLEEQLRSVPDTPDWRELRLGLQLLTLGLVKKLGFADGFASLIDPLWADVGGLDMLAAWLVVLGYAFQIYFDFSGYSDMAVGLGAMLGFRFPQNFDSPYKATDIGDFWRRWHMTLSEWLRDYLYIPLGGSRGGRWRTARNLVVTMFLGGLWHGAEWTFVVWGLYHGLLLAIFHTWRAASPCSLPAWPARLLTFAAVLVGWVFFRAEDLPQAATLLRAMAGLRGLDAGALTRHSALFGDCLTGLFLCWALPNTWELRYPPSMAWAVVYGLLLGGCVTLLRQPSPFLYFQF